VFFTVEQAIDWLQTQLEGQPAPYLGYVHLLPPHEPYVTRREFADSFDDGWQPPAKPLHFFNSGWDDAYLADTRREYDQAIAYVDAEFGRLFDYLEGSGKLENTILVFTSDHGEMFERGISLHNTPTLYEPLIRVPLMVWAPGLDERLDVHTPTSCVDFLLCIERAANAFLDRRPLLRAFRLRRLMRAVCVVEAKMLCMPHGQGHWL
jgi:arylsulfatase A-like enzyme